MALEMIRNRLIPSSPPEPDVSEEIE